MSQKEYNRGKFRKYIGVGGHLFAIACEASIMSGKERLVIEEAQARALIEKYMKE